MRQSVLDAVTFVAMSYTIQHRILLVTFFCLAPALAVAQPNLKTTLQTSANADNPPRDTYLAVEQRETLPFGNLKATTRVAVALFNADQTRTLGDDLWSLAVEGQKGKLNYGARVYSVGETFDDSDIGKARLGGLNPASDGTELWAVLRAGKFTVKPRLQDFTRHNTNGNEERRVSTLTFAAPMHQGSRMSWTFGMQNIAPDHGNFIKQSRSSAVSFTRPGTLWRVSYLDEATRSLNWHRRRTHHEILGNVSPIRAMRLIPRISRTTSFDGRKLQTINQHAGILLDYVMPNGQLPPLELGIGINEKHVADSATTSQILDFSLKTNWERRLTSSDVVSMGARLSYKEARGRSIVDDGIGIYFTLELSGG